MPMSSESKCNTHIPGYTCSNLDDYILSKFILELFRKRFVPDIIKQLNHISVRIKRPFSTKPFPQQQHET